MKPKISGTALRITLTYVVIAAIWIVGSDRLLLLLAPDAPWAQSDKGMAFVAVTGVLLYGLIQRALNERRQVENKAEVQAQLLDHATDAIITTDLSFNIQAVNAAAEALYGWKAAEMIGKPLVELLQPEYPGLSHEAMLGQLAAQGRWEGEATQRGKDASPLTVRTAMSYLIDRTGKRIGVLAVSRDIERRKRGERERQASEERFRYLFENMLEGYAYCRMIFEGGQPQDFVYLAVNHAFETLTGLKDVVGKPVSQVIPGIKEANPELFEIYGRVAQTGKPEKFETYLDALEIWLAISVYSPEKGFFVAIFDNITESRRLKQAEQEERRLTEALLDTASAINSTFDVKEVLARILVNIEAVIPTTGANVMLVDYFDRTVRVVARDWSYSQNDVPVPQLEVRLPYLDRPHLRQMVENNAALAIPDTHAFPGWNRQPHTEWIRSYAGAPIVIGDTCIGLLNLDSRIPDTFTDEDATRLRAFADQAAIAIHNAQLYAELETYSELLEQAVSDRTTELRRTTERVTTILNNNPDAMILLKADGKVETGNPPLADWFGYAIDDLRGRSPADLLAPESRQSFQEAIEAVIDRLETRRLEAVAQRKDGTTFDVGIALAPVQEAGSLSGIVCSLKDISKQKQVERMKDAFVSNVSHELRTPITSIKLNQDLLARDPERQAVYMERLRREIDRLNALIEDLLRLSRLDQGRAEVNLTHVNLNELVEQHVGDRSPIAASRSLTLRSEPQGDLPPVLGDSGLLGQALSVLLTNALNYTPEGGSVTVSTRLSLVDGRRWVGLSVRDTGPGIPPDDLPHLGERFYRGKAGHISGKTGTGLGLAIAREIMNRHGGRMEVLSDGVPGQGVTFTLWLPADDAQAGPPAQPPGE